MLKNFLKVFAFQLQSNKALALINVLGFAVALVCCIFIALFVRHELSHDRVFSQFEHIYRVATKITLPDGSLLSFSTSSARLGPFLEESFPPVRMATRMMQRDARLSTEADLAGEEKLNMVDSNFFSVFDFTWLRGEAAFALSTPNALVLTESSARKYFGGDEPIGKVLSLDGDVPLVVTGVVDDLPSNTHFTGTAFASLDLLELTTPDPSGVLGSWQNTNFHSYLLLEQGADPADLAAHLAAVVDAQVVIGPGITTAHYATPLRAIHMLPPTMDDLRPGGSLLIVYVFSLIGLCILIMACINFVNLSTARATMRGKEVGLRKVLGATRGQLTLQFMGEAILLSALAMALALVAVELLTPALNGLLGIDLQAGGGNGPAGALLFTVVALGVLAGWYPSLHLSAFRPSRVLKGQLPSGQGGSSLRSLLVILQFTIVIVLLVAVWGIRAQLKYTDAMDLGFDRDNLVVLDVSKSSLGQQYGAFRNELLQGDGVLSVATSQSSSLRGEGSISISLFVAEGDETVRSLPHMGVDSDYFAVYGVGLLAGRNFTPVFPSGLPSSETEARQGALILNERAARDFGWTPESAIGKGIRINQGVQTVVGVVSNTIEHAKRPANPIVYSPVKAADIITVRVEEGRTAEALAHIDASWEALVPGEPLQRMFLDEKINALYIQNSRQLEISVLFSLLAVIVACLGLYGLAAFSTQCRSKEIGVRKAVGGSVWSIVLLLTGDISKLVLIANLLAWPIAYLALERWLSNFAYRIDLGPLIFLGSGAIALCIAWMTVGGTAAKAASQRPVLALRYE